MPVALSATGVRLAHVAGEQVGRHGVTAAGEEAQHLVVEAGGLVDGRQRRVLGRLVGEHRQHRGVLVAEQELDHPVLQRLEARGRPEMRPDARVLAGRQRLEHAPLLDQLLLHVLDPGDALERAIEPVFAKVADGRLQFGDDQLHPQLRGLVLDDEQQLVVVVRRAARLLGGQQHVETQVSGVTQAVAEVGGDADFQRAVDGIGHGDAEQGGRTVYGAASPAQRMNRM